MKPAPVTCQGRRIGGLTHGDVDPRVPGAELYTGGKLGILYQVLPTEDGLPDGRRQITLALRRLVRMGREYPREAFLAAVSKADPRSKLKDWRDAERFFHYAAQPLPEYLPRHLVRSGAWRSGR